MRVNKIIPTALLILAVVSAVFAVFSEDADADPAEYTDGNYRFVQVGSNAHITGVVDRNITGQLVIPESLSHGGKSFDVVRIGTGAFRDIPGITEVVVSSHVNEIGLTSFLGCTGIENVVLSDSVKWIYPMAFDGCVNLKSIYLTKGVMSVESSAFESSGLEHIEVDPENIMFKTDGRILFDRLGKEIFLAVPTFSGAAVIPDGVERIGEFVFRNCTGLTSVEFPDSIMKIGYRAFDRCTGLTGTFCIPAGVTSMGRDSYYDGELHFHCSTILNDTNVTDIWVDPANKAYSSEDGLLLSKDGRALLSCPGGRTGNVEFPSSVTSIQEGVFLGCSQIESVTVPDTVGYIGEMAFQGCSKLKEVHLPDGLEKIEQSTFSVCRSLESLDLPDSVRYIEKWAFDLCKSLKELDLPEGLESIGEEAFSRTGFDEIVIPSSVKSMGPHLFDRSEVRKVILLPDSVSLPEGMFQEVESLEELYILGKVASVGSGAFDMPLTRDGVRLNPSDPGVLDDSYFKAVGEGLVHQGKASEQPMFNPVWDGSSLTDWYDPEEDSFLLRGAAQLAGVSELVASGEDFSGKTIKLANDMELHSSAWVPIGGDVPFAGRFSGNGHTLSGMNVTGDVPYGGLFGVAAGAEIGYITVRGEVSVSGNAAGGIAGKLTDGSVVGCNSYAALSVSGTETDAFLGGIVGYCGDSSVVSCCNYGAVSGNGASQHAGGIAGGAAGSSVENCCNTGRVSSAAGAEVSAVVPGSGFSSENCYFLTGTSDSPSDAERFIGFSQDLKTDGTVEVRDDSGKVVYSGDSVIDAMNAYLDANPDGMLSGWTAGPDGLPQTGYKDPYAEPEEIPKEVFYIAGAVLLIAILVIDRIRRNRIRKQSY